ncbi:MAG TPA: class I SAM-dependent methyltransferase [Acidobacteriaceae bacterium]|nr:class I SAM-dependent methyltransferase [Acidobacteriaceae bacterium]
MPSFFGGKDKTGGGHASNERIPRHSSGWGQILDRMRKQESLRVLDIGPTSSGNINLITALGHSIYLANLVEDGAKPEWVLRNDDGTPAGFDAERFLATHLNFSGRGFDIVLFWDTADYLPEPLLAPVLDRLHQVMAPGGSLLAMFHSASGPSLGQPARTDFCRYHLTEESQVKVQHAGDYPILNTYTNRQIEKLFSAYKSFRFFLGKDNLREVVVTR